MPFIASRLVGRDYKVSGAKCLPFHSAFLSMGLETTTMYLSCSRRVVPEAQWVYRFRNSTVITIPVLAILEEGCAPPATSQGGLS